MIAIFGEMGFSVAEGPDIEDDFHNFEALNIPPEHPARQMHDTFYLPEKSDASRMVLRTHTSPVQIAPWRTKSPRSGSSRRDLSLRFGPHSHADVPPSRRPRGRQDFAYGTPQGCLIEFCRAYFEVDDVPVPTKLLPVHRTLGRGGYWLFARPGQHQDWRGDDWLEILGCGMVHPNVLRAGGIDPDEYRVRLWHGARADRDVGIRHPGSPHLFEADLRWLRHYGFVPMEVPTMLRGRRMKFTLKWLKEHLETDASLDALAERLTMLGLEVEEISDAAADLKGFRTAKVVKAEQHPERIVCASVPLMQVTAKRYKSSAARRMHAPA